MGAVAAATVLLAGLLTSQPAAGDDTTGESDPEQAASDQAQQTGERVEIAAFTDERSQTFAEPDGSFTLETSAVPQRVRTGEGWAPVDTDLVAAEDGTVRPKAAPAEIAFSGGGSGPMARVGMGAKELSLDWPWELPEPQLDGSQATYTDVLPDVDLVLTAGVDGFTQVLVVNSAEAAQDERLAELELGLAAQGVELSQDDHGNLTGAAAGGGGEVFTAPTPTMWDSSGQEAPAQARRAEPATGARTEVVETELAEGALLLRPHAGMLADEATEFPVYIDPSVSVARQAWAYVNKRFPGTRYYNPSDADTGVGYEPQYGNTKRAFWRFAIPDRLKRTGTDIDAVTLRMQVPHAFGCTDASFELWRTDYLTANSATWNNQPDKMGRQDTVNVDHGRPACGGSGVEFNATSGYRNAAADDLNSITLGLYGNESTSGTNHDWRRFDKDAKLVVVYNNPPDTPATGRMSDSLGGVCSTDRTKPRIVNETEVVLRGWARDYDSQHVGQKVMLRFAWWANGEGSRLGEADTAYTDVAEYPGGSYRSATARNLPEGQLIGYRAMAHDQQDWSSWSTWCWIIVDTANPEAGPEVTSTDYPAGDTQTGSVGRPGEFTFTSNGVDDATAYHYSLNDDTCSTRLTPQQPGGAVTATITPRRDGPNLLHARTTDPAGNSSACTLVYTFTVAPAAHPVAHFGFGEGGGTTAADTASDRTATAEGAVSWTRGRVGAGAGADYRVQGTAVATDGSGARLATGGPVVDTAEAFSVSAWVRLDGKDGNHTAVSQDGDVHSGFYLGYQATQGLDNWIFKIPSADETGSSGWIRAVSDAPARTGVWTHLLGTYDPETGQARLYVDGVEQEVTEEVAAPWRADGPLVIGGGRFDGAPSDPWPGAIDEVTVWDRVVIGDAPAEADAHAEPWHLANAAVLQGRWQLDEAEGTQVADSSDHGLAATLHGDPATVWSGALNGVTFSPGATLNGVDERITTGDPAIRTDRSFTVAAWVRLDEVGTNSTALSQNGRAHSGFYLGHQNTYEWDQWVFKMAPADEVGASGWSRALSPEAPELGSWIHLAATYDHADGRMALYLGGELVGSAQHQNAWHAGGSTVIGAARFEEALSDAWNGDIDDVHVYQGVLAPDQLELVQRGQLPFI
ncbi:LamG-like jellyroll fold domain-containing protein [Streptomonospora nanhaiensis]|uniref:LamG-like jellyroll fold domain-containing protein n=1 Tax=Streptomonospora nanhaiensis TaxID=1323731 RepID=UPI0027DF0F8B|nr:LamG-like jellyroll fold domain-containing protein [Streptomonospora nanhaiensis]